MASEWSRRLVLSSDFLSCAFCSGPSVLSSFAIASVGVPSVERWRGGAQWEALEANLKQVGVGSKPLLWGVTATDQIVRGIAKTT